MVQISGRELSKYTLPEPILLHQRENQAGLSRGTEQKSLSWMLHCLALFFPPSKYYHRLAAFLEAMQED